VKIVRVDLRDAGAVETLVRENRPDWVFHLAAISQVRLSWERRRETFDTNLLGTLNLFEALRRRAPKARVLFVSSSDVYGSPASRSRRKLFREKDRTGVASPYAFTKIAGELLAGFYAEVEKMPIVIARPFPHTGPGQAADFVCSDWARQIASFERSIVPGRVPRPFLLKIGNVAIRRDYTDVRDVVRAYTLLMKKGRRGEVYNVCSGFAPTLREILGKLLRLSRTRIVAEVDPARLRRTDIPCLAGDSAKIRRQTGWTPRIPLDRTLEDLLNDWRRKLDGFKSDSCSRGRRTT
jgi:GDP-4-dehydro-6-deoxy-D-mannose reductase